MTITLSAYLIKRHAAQWVRHLIAEPQTPSRVKRRELSSWQRRFWEHQIRNDMARQTRRRRALQSSQTRTRYACGGLTVLNDSSLRATRRISAPLGGSGLEEEGDYGEFNE